MLGVVETRTKDAVGESVSSDTTAIGIGDPGLDNRKRHVMDVKLPSIADSVTDTFLKRFQVVEKIGEGSYSEVLKCKNRDTGMLVACKRLKHVYKSWNQVNDIAEVIALRTLNRHPHILQMLEIHYDVRQGKVSLVFEVMDMNLYELIKDRKRLLPESTVRVLMYQLMKALRHLHKFGVFHRDIKPENILIRTDSNVLKLGDLGSVRGVYSQPPFTEYISTRWYRSPECLLTAGQYGFKMDIWAAGCVFYEILTLQPLFPGSSEIDQINRIHTIMGTPPTKTLQKFQKFTERDKELYRTRNQQHRWDSMLKIISECWKQPNKSTKNYEWNVVSKEKGGLDRKLPASISSGARDLVKLMLIYDPDSRPSSQRIINHPYFHDVRDFKVPDSDIIKTPTIAVCGDEYGRTMISQYYGHVDLKTLGDKKRLVKNVKMQFTHQHKQPVVESLISKKSSPLLRGAKSPETPHRERIESKVEVRELERKEPNAEVSQTEKKELKVEVRKRERKESKAEVPDRERKEAKLEILDLHKKQDSNVKIPDLGINESKLGVLERKLKEPKIELPKWGKDESKVELPKWGKAELDIEIPKWESKEVETQVSEPETKVEVPEWEINDNKTAVTELGRKEYKMDVSERQTKETNKVELPPNPILGSRLLLNRITAEELKKINQTREMVHMKPILSSSSIISTAHSSTVSTQDLNHNVNPEGLSDFNSPYTKAPNELSKEGRKKLLLQTLRQQATKRIQPKIDTANMNVPPQVAAAALRYQNQTAAAAQKAKQALHMNNTSSTGNKRSTSPVDNSYLKSSFELKRIQISPDKKQIIDDLENSRLKKHDTKVFHTPLLNSALKKNPENEIKANLTKTLKLEQQNRLQLRPTDVKPIGRTKIPSYNNKTAVAKEPVIRASNNNKANGEQNSSQAASNLLFPRNRFGSLGAGAATGNTTRKTQVPKENQKFIRNFDNKNTLTPEVVSNSVARVAEKLGLKHLMDSNNNNASTFVNKPPLPPPPPPNSNSNIAKEARIAQILENAADKSNNTNQSDSHSRKTFGMFNEPEAVKRRIERIRAQLRDEVYCSSDDDVVSTMRQKLDILISERARRACAKDSSFDDPLQIEEDDGSFETRARNQRPRKLLKKCTLSRPPNYDF